MKKFVIGEEYSMRSACDHNCVWTYTVIDRTTQTITIKENGRFDKPAQKCRINKGASEIYGSETVYPLGRYSMAPALHP